MNIYENYPCESINYCSNIDDYRPIQSTLLTRFTTTDRSDLWRTTNQDYGAFYYRQIPEYCIPDNLKSKIHRRYNHFQDWLSYQTKCQHLKSSFTKNSMNNNHHHHHQTIFPSNRNETIRITHRKKFVSTCNNNQLNENIFSPCGEAGLITEYIVKKILHQLQYLINPNEYHDVLECAQILVSEILTQEPSLCINEIIDRVINIMITPPNSKPCYSNISTESIPCPSPQTIPEPNSINNELPLSTTVSTSGPFINCNQNVFDKLTNLENAISKISKSFC